MTKIETQDITGLVLAGGRGSRMGGVDKGLQNFRGLPLALHTLMRLQMQTGNVMVNANRNLAAYEAFGAPVWPDVLADYAEVKSGNASTWNQMMSLAGASANDAVYWRLAGRNPDGSRNPAFPVLLDVENLIDYMILHIFHGADDWPNHNWWAGRATRNTTAQPIILNLT